MDQQRPRVGGLRQKQGKRVPAEQAKQRKISSRRNVTQQRRITGLRRKQQQRSHTEHLHGPFHKLFTGAVRWITGVVVVAMVATITGVLTGIPAQLFNTAKIKDTLRTGPDTISHHQHYIFRRPRAIDSAAQRLPARPSAVADDDPT